MEVVLAGRFLEKTEIVVGVGTALAVPVDYESRDAHAAGLLNLLSQDSGILAGVADVDVATLAEPRHVDSEELRGGRRRLRVLAQRTMTPRRRAPGDNHEASYGEAQQRLRQMHAPFLNLSFVDLDAVMDSTVASAGSRMSTQEKPVDAQNCGTACSWRMTHRSAAGVINTT